MELEFAQVSRPVNSDIFVAEAPSGVRTTGNLRVRRVEKNVRSLGIARALHRRTSGVAQFNASRIERCLSATARHRKGAVGDDCSN